MAVTIIDPLPPQPPATPSVPQPVSPPSPPANVTVTPQSAFIATVIVNGVEYTNWESVQMEADAGQYPIRTMTLVTAEMNQPFDSWTSMKLAPNDLAQGYLAGIQVINGIVAVRQASIEANRHLVQIVVMSSTQGLQVSTVDGNPGQYVNATLEQIVNSVCSKVGVSFSLDGSASGADKPFPRVSEHAGETRFNFIDRLCQMRDVWLRDDEFGTLIGFRDSSGTSGALLVEGQNIISGRVIMRNDYAVSQLTSVGQHPGEQSDNAAGDETRDSSATVTNPGMPFPRPAVVPTPEPADSQDAAMFANHAMTENLFSMLEAEFVVPGWFAPTNQLWIDMLTNDIQVYSPSLFPDNYMTLRIMGVVHSQDSQRGSTTTIRLKQLVGSWGSYPPIQSDGTPSVPPQAQPNGDDVQ